MHTFKHLYEKMITPANVLTAAINASKHKTRRKSVFKAMLDIAGTVRDTFAAIFDPDWTPPHHTAKHIIDGSNGKPRSIIHPQFRVEQVWHHALMQPLEPIILRSMYEQAYSCRPAELRKSPTGKTYLKKFGPQAAAHQIAKWVQGGKKLYVAELDVYRAYQNVDIPLLREKLARIIDDALYMAQMDKLLAPMDDGLPLGFYPSPWLWNFYMTDFDHHTATLGAKYLRYADNIYLICPNKRKLHRIVQNVSEYISDRLKMKMKQNWQIYRFEWDTGKVDKDGNKIYRGRAINVLGYIVHCDRITVRKNNLKRITRKARRIGKKDRITWFDASGMISSLGWTENTDTRIYVRENVLTHINLRQLKKLVRRHSQAEMPRIMQRRQEINDRVESYARLAGITTC